MLSVKHKRYIENSCLKLCIFITLGKCSKLRELNKFLLRKCKEPQIVL